jgi:hypothetical protein
MPHNIVKVLLRYFGSANEVTVAQLLPRADRYKKYLSDPSRYGTLTRERVI